MHAERHSLLRLRTLGGLSVERPDGPSPATTVTSARRRLALLAVLAASDTTGLPRDKLLALFWPDSDTDRARHALDQALYALKRNLGVDSLVLGREELALDPSAISSDIRDLKDALAKRDYAAAVELYSGPFLDSVYISGSPEFDQWADAERAHVAHDVAVAMESLAAEAATRGDHGSAAEWWRRRAAQDPADARVLIALMSELAASGDPSAAVRQADIYQAFVRADEDAEPNADVAALAERLKRAPIVASATAVQPQRQEAMAAPPTGRRSAPYRLGNTAAPIPSPSITRRLRAAGTAAVIIAIALSTAWVVSNRHGGANRAWVLPADFENRTRDSIFDRALDAALSAGLEQSSYVTVYPRPLVEETLMRMGRVAAQPAAGASAVALVAPALNEALAREVAQREGIPMVLVSAIDRVDSNYMLTASLIEPRSGRSLWTDKIVANRRADVIDALDELVRRLRRRIGESASALSKHDRPLPEVTTRSLEALHKYADGIAAADASQYPAAMELWQQAVAIDSNFALAHALLGAAYYYANDRPRGDAHYDRALAVLDRLTDHERLVVQASAESWRGNREQAITIRRALLAEFPDDPAAWGQIGYDYLRLGRPADAIAALRAQLSHNPNDATTLLNLATALRGPRDLDEAIRTYRRAFSLRSELHTAPNVNTEYGGTLIAAGRLSEARAAFALMFDGPPNLQAQGHRSIGLLSMLEGHYTDASAHFRDAVLLTQGAIPGLTEFRNRLFLASAEQERGWRDSARTELRAAYGIFRRTNIEPGFLAIFGRALVRDSQIVLASEVLDSLARRVKPNNPSDQAYREILAGEVALARGSVDSATELLRLAAKFDSTACFTQTLARALGAAGNLSGAARLYERIGADPVHAFGSEGEACSLTAWRDAGAIYERMGDYARARTAYDRQLSLWSQPDSDLVSLRDARLGLARTARGRLQPAGR